MIIEMGNDGSKLIGSNPKIYKNFSRSGIFFNPHSKNVFLFCFPLKLESIDVKKIKFDIFFKFNLS